MSKVTDLADGGAGRGDDVHYVARSGVDKKLMGAAVHGLFAYKTADESRTTDTPTDDDDMHVVLEPDSAYEFEIIVHGYITDDNTTLEVIIPISGPDDTFKCLSYQATDFTAGADTLVGVLAANTSDETVGPGTLAQGITKYASDPNLSTIVFKGMYFTGATQAGPLAVQWYLLGAPLSAPVMLLKGSYMKLIKRA